MVKGSGRNEVSRGDGGEGEMWGPDLRADPGRAGEFERPRRGLQCRTGLDSWLVSPRPQRCWWRPRWCTEQGDGYRVITQAPRTLPALRRNKLFCGRENLTWAGALRLGERWRPCAGCLQSGVCLFLSICNVVLQPTSQLAIRRVELRSLPCTARGEAKLRTSPHWLQPSQLLTDRGVHWGAWQKLTAL